MKRQQHLIQAIESMPEQFDHFMVAKAAGVTDMKAYTFCKKYAEDGKIRRIKIGRCFSYSKGSAAITMATLKKDINEALGLKNVTNKNLSSLQKQCIVNIENARQKINNKYHSNIPMPDVSFDLKGTTAGKAWYRFNRIQINPVLLKENPEQVSVQTSLHEFAHIAAYTLGGKAHIQPHGKEWKAVMRDLGLKAQRCHTMDVSNCANAHKRFPAKCTCMTHMVTKQMINKIINNPNNYFCKKCKQYLKVMA